MQKRIFFACCLSAADLLSSTLHASETLTWEECYRRTVSNNLQLATATLQLKESEAALKSQQSVYYPDVTANARRSISENETANGWQNSESASASIRAEYSIFSGFGNRARVSQAEAELYAAAANYDQTRSNVDYNLRRIFAQQLYAQELIDLAEAIAERRADNVRLVEMRYEGGRENKGSLSLKRAQLTEAEYDVREARRQLQLAQRQLATVMGKMESPSFIVVGRLQCSEPPERVALNELAAMTPTYRSAEADVKAAEQGYIIARSQRFPSISADASAGKSGDTDLHNGSWSAGLSVSLPLFRGGELSQNMLAAGLRRERLRLEAEQTMLQLLNDLQSALNTWRNRYENLRVQEELLKAAELRAEVARAQYQQGLISFQDWDQIENTLINYQKNRLLSLRNADQAEADWRNTLGQSAR